MSDPLAPATAYPGTPLVPGTPGMPVVPGTSPNPGIPGDLGIAPARTGSRAGLAAAVAGGTIPGSTAGTYASRDPLARQFVSAQQPQLGRAYKDSELVDIGLLYDKLKLEAIEVARQYILARTPENFQVGMVDRANVDFPQPIVDDLAYVGDVAGSPVTTARYPDGTAGTEAVPVEAVSPVVVQGDTVGDKRVI